MAKIKAKSKSKIKARPKLDPRDDPNQLTTALTPRTLDQQVNAQTALYAAPAEAELSGQRAVHNQMMGQLPVWYGDYLKARAGALAVTGQAYGAALGLQANAANTGSALDAQQRGAQNQQMAGDAAARGQVVDPTIAAQGQQAAASRRSQLDAQMGLTAGLGAAEVGYRANQVVVGAGQKVKAMEGEAARGRALDTAGNELAIKKGEFATTARQKLLDAEHTKQLENKAFGLNAAKAQIDADQGAQSLKLKEAAQQATNELNAAKLTNDTARIAIAQRNSDIAAQRADAYVKNQNKLKGSTKLSSTARASTGNARKDIAYAISHIPQMLAHNPPKKVKDKNGKWVNETDDKGNPVPDKSQKMTMAQVRQALENGEGPFKSIPHDAINAALKILDKNKGGYLDAAQISGLRAAYPGIHIGSLGYPTKNSRRSKAKVKSSGKLKADSGDILAGSKPRP